MFDTYVSGKTEYVPYEKSIVEHRAPTDDSIRLWEQMKEKAYKSILDTIEIRDNCVNVNSIVYDDMLTLSKVCSYRLLLNGKEITGEVRWSSNELKSKAELYHKIVDSAARDIAVEIVKALDKSL